MCAARGPRRRFAGCFRGRSQSARRGASPGGAASGGAELNWGFFAPPFPLRRGASDKVRSVRTKMSPAWRKASSFVVGSRDGVLSHLTRTEAAQRRRIRTSVFESYSAPPFARSSPRLRTQARARHSARLRTTGDKILFRIVKDCNPPDGSNPDMRATLDDPGFPELADQIAS